MKRKKNNIGRTGTQQKNGSEKSEVGLSKTKIPGLSKKSKKCDSAHVTELLKRP